MKRWSGLLAVLGSLVIGGQVAHAGQVSLADWCVNVNGDTATACNGGGGGGVSSNPDGGTVSLTNFDQTLEGASNTLGSVTVAMNAGAGQYVSFYADYDVDYDTYGSFADYATIVGSLPSGVSYSVNDPNIYTGLTSPSGYTLFDEFANNDLDDTNYVGTPALPDNECCDVAFALSLAVNAAETVTFSVTTTAPDSGFYIQQTNQYTSESIFLAVSTSSNNSPGPVVPEPSTLGLTLAASIVALGYGWKRRGNQSIE
jgi:hypothetical protein